MRFRWLGPCAAVAFCSVRLSSCAFCSVRLSSCATQLLHPPSRFPVCRRQSYLHGSRELLQIQLGPISFGQEIRRLLGLTPERDLVDYTPAWVISQDNSHLLFHLSPVIRLSNINLNYFGALTSNTACSIVAAAIFVEVVIVSTV